MFTQDELEEVKEYLATCPKDSKVYLGCDSLKYKKGGTWFARYTTVLVVHISNSKGCKVFGYSTRERDYDQTPSKPRMRLMNEVYKVAECYLALAEELEAFEIEMHLDVNPDEAHGSNIVFKEAVGYILGMTGMEPKVKPEAFAASYAADQGVRRNWFAKTQGEGAEDLASPKAVRKARKKVKRRNKARR